MTTIYTPFADGRTVRDIVEHTPALVNETWCRDLLRHLLDSLERQYETGAPHRPISPDTIVMLANNEPLLLPAPEEVGAAGAAQLPADLHALAVVVHYAITAELPPDGPLGPRLYDDYSTELTNGLDRCLGPNQRLRPKTISDMRTLLGIAAPAADQPVHASTLAEAAPVANEAAVQPQPDMPTAAETVLPAFTAEPQESAPVPDAPAPDYSQPVPAPVMQEVHPAPVAASAPDLSEPRLHTPSATEAAPDATPAQAAMPERRVEPPQPASPPVTEPLLRTPAAATTASFAAGDSTPTRKPTALEAATAARLHEEAARKLAVPAAPPPRPKKSNSVQRWGWIAGAAVVLLAAGSALVSYLQQSDSSDMVAVSLPPAERAANGLDAGETVVAPRADENNAAAPVEAPATDADAGLLSGATEDAAAAPDELAAPGAVPGKAGEAIVNGVTYKLLIKPWGTVYVDDVDRGVSPPVKRLTLSRGKHTIRIVNPNFPEHVLNVNAGSRESTTIAHDFTAKAE
ncbi:hypothetical protein [Massilia sp. SYSU DXS3249]